MNEHPIQEKEIHEAITRIFEDGGGYILILEGDGKEHEEGINISGVKVLETFIRVSNEEVLLTLLNQFNALFRRVVGFSSADGVADV